MTKPDDIEPASVAHHERTSVSPPPKGATLRDVDVAMALFDSPEQIHEPIDPAEERKLVRKIDFMILPYLAVCYAFFYIDKTTLSYAAIFGIRKDLNLTGADYNWLSSVFYFGFLFWAFPTNFLMQRLPIGFFLMLQAAAKSFGQLLALRFLAGAAEACSDPSFMLITSMWYTRKQQPVRIGLWYTANGFGIALGGFLGYAIGSIRGALPSWKYEFLIIGALCSSWGIVMCIFLPDSPVTAKGLSRTEKRMAVQRLRENQTGIENKHLKGYQVKEAFLDVKLYLFFVLGIVGNVPNGGISNFGTLIIQGFGFSQLGTTLLQIPYGVLIAISILICVYLNDHFVNRRCMFIIIFLLPNIAGAFGLRFISPENQAGRLISYYLTGPYNAAFVMVLSLQTANTSGHTKKIIGPFFYLTSQAPYYELGIWSMIVSHLLEVLVIATFWFLLRRENRRRDEIQVATEGGLEGRDLDTTAFADMTDRENLNFRYIY
ncbi:hypothetical protein FHL15_007011 [Xylaria flabelliformis]|uniref:Major facilitator superfamily (MFS) profile domain-containing protein n=1 Tax=Xylaria flabelliformis TaxID=2512241 RepID=A0A553HW05_9PEZI|nr:hypothetical protein FHL15_007011 [Xylaria flabelliformis]